MIKIINYSVKFVVAISLLVVLIIFSSFWYFSSGLPDYKKLANYNPPISSRVYSQDGKLIAEYALEKRLFVPYKSIPKKIINLSFFSSIHFLNLFLSLKLIFIVENTHSSKKILSSTSKFCCLTL